MTSRNSSDALKQSLPCCLLHVELTSRSDASVRSEPRRTRTLTRAGFVPCPSHDPPREKPSCKVQKCYRAPTTCVGVSLPFGSHIQNLVTFGDSYTANYIPGTSWPQYLAAYENVTLHPFAVSGATCNNLTTPRVNFPDVLHNELSNYHSLTTNGSVMLDPANTLYTLWIGTNDVGAGELLTGQSTSGASIVNVSQCHIQVIQTLYQSGARNFLLQNMIPLDKTPMYAADSYPDRYWDLERNTTGWNVFMKELVASGNELSRLLAQISAPALEGATIGFFDSHALFADIIAHPALYLNGTAPLNVTGAVSSCVYALDSTERTCTTASGTDKDSFIWYDELHPSEQTNRIVAREIAKVVNGTSGRWLQVFKG